MTLEIKTTGLQLNYINLLEPIKAGLAQELLFVQVILNRLPKYKPVWDIFQDNSLLSEMSGLDKETG